MNFVDYEVVRLGRHRSDKDIQRESKDWLISTCKSNGFFNQNKAEHKGYNVLETYFISDRQNQQT